MPRRGIVASMAALLDPKIPDLVNAMEAAEILAVSRQAVIDFVASGQLPARKVGRVWLLRRSVVERFAAARRLAAEAEEASADQPISRP